ncbi:GntR family transcriptional regulator [Opitutaceae bacterium TAV4]|uniref:GntR family transcriptional regulator n=1 Tax=Geminisphaera colitermitum TaxID=1148786 RepID=UPI000158CD5B|nr:GntR family transcriptional regulator [Geminisphaera colitermitum]RRJ96644.1 GntR family transcriptional regulator [Opitutaceae bacterium TAV4]RRK00692.1 GntR family transcriptional regulator [Opitutaceae bacterium TAV3]
MPTSPTPTASKKVRNIHADLRERVLACEWQQGDTLPTELELADRFDCSPNTIAKAMMLLASEGLVERRARAGTRVLRNTPAPTSASGTEEGNGGVELDAFAFIYPSAQHEGIWRTVQGFQAAAHECNRRAVMLTTGTDYRKEAEYISRLSEFHVRGAVVYPNVLTPEDQAAFSQLLVSAKFPIVLASVNLLGLGCPAVTVDAFHAGYTMTRHLIDRGLKKIGYFSNRSSSVSMRDRYLGYRKAMEEASLPMPAEWVFLEPTMHPDFADPVREPTELARGYLAQARAVEGVVCNTDFLALGLIQAARELGINVPRDLRVTGIDDYALASKGDIPLTTYHVPYETIGAKAFEVLAARVANKGTGPVSDIQIRGEIVVRASA